MITLIIFISLFVIQLVNGMVLYDGSTKTLDHLVQKSLRYKHHMQNYIRSLDDGIIPTGLRINKKPAINTVSSDFHSNYKTILSKAEKDLVQLLLVESDEIIAKVDFEIQSHIKEYHPNNYNHECELLQKKPNSYKHNRAFRKSKSKEKREVNIDTGKETNSEKTLLRYADRVEKPTEQVVDLSQVYLDLLAHENKSSKMGTSPQIMH